MKYFKPNDPGILKRLIYEDEFVFAFPSKMPIVPGHSLVCPKRRVLTISQLTPEEVVAIFNLLQKLTQAMKQSFGAEGFNYAWNEGDIAGQTVKHLHIHVLPRKKADKGVINYEPRKFLYRPGKRPQSPAEELIKVAKLIKSNFKP